MSIHIGAESGDIAPTVLLPGDPERARWAAGAFLANGWRQVNRVRGMAGFTGQWHGHPVTIHGSGMGMASLSIYVNELIRNFGVQRIIRIGSCGAMQDRINLRDLVIAMTATSIATPSRAIMYEVNFAPCADFGLLEQAISAARRRDMPHHVGGIYSSDTFYDERPDLNEIMTRHGILAVEMETAELYTLAARHSVQALTVLTVSDHLQTGDVLSSEARETSFSGMVAVALDAAFPGQGG